MRGSAKKSKERILDATLELVLRQGFAATSLDQILEKTGLTKGAFFYHFKNKEDLAHTLMAKWVELDLALLSELQTRSERLANDPLQQVLLMVGLAEEMFDSYEEPPVGCLITAFMYQEGAFSESSRVLAEKSFESWRIVIEGKLLAALTKHSPRVPFDASAVADMFTTVIEGGFSMSKTYKNPKAMVLQLRNYRLFLELLFGLENQTPPVDTK
jgi:TetR/AcrR family transcriptional regulator, transcriptional repressor for nem operon